MTLLKNVLITVALLPLTASIAIAQGGNEPIGGIDIITKRSIPVAAIAKQPILGLQKPSINHQVAKPIEQVKLDQKDKDYINKMIHYSETSGTHNPHDSKLFDEISESTALVSIRPIDSVRPDKPGVNDEWPLVFHNKSTSDCWLRVVELNNPRISLKTCDPNQIIKKTATAKPGLYLQPH